ncbi:glycosyltransferase family 2 protein [Psychroflexus tropicus]|uniref:glycosyltransferase family 2 protein n=1 Tax=Psychroflexus tropicus TaxID=197345 RepID=UPI00035DF7C2|nr:glycosyltransferase family 2 protein [Psychroflexus tropicus]
MPRVAIVITAKNEERLLKQNLRYHFALGIHKAFVYFDGVTDNGPETIKNLPRVVAQNSVEPEKYKHLENLSKFTSNANEHHTARQCLNTYDAMLKCKRDGIDWLISIDADELFYPGSDIKDLSVFFDALEAYDVIKLPPLEIINRKMTYTNVMLEESLFKTKKNFKSRLDQIYFDIKNPYGNKSFTISYWLGHTMGKCILNVKSDIIPKNVHRYETKDNTKIKSITKGNILHYHMYDFEDFIKKFKNFEHHPPVFLSGNEIGSLKSLWIQLVNDPKMTKEQLKEYYKKNLLFNEKKLKRLNKTRLFNLVRRKEKAIVEIKLPRQILSNIKHD